MTLRKRCADLAATLCGALVLGGGPLAANGSPPVPTQPRSAAVVKQAPPITQGVRRFVAGSPLAPVAAQQLPPTDLASSVQVSYDEAGNMPISPPGSTTGTYSASRATPGWVHVTVKNTGRADPPDGKRPASFKVSIRFIYPYRNVLLDKVFWDHVDFTYTEQLEPVATWQYKFHFLPAGHYLLSAWHPLKAEVRVHGPARPPEANQANNDSFYTVKFTN